MQDRDHGLAVTLPALDQARERSLCPAGEAECVRLALGQV